jgi:hypothetical protein
MSKDNMEELQRYDLHLDGDSNAVTVPVAQWLGNRIMSFERDV